jgi:hypothetical protein
MRRLRVRILLVCLGLTGTIRADETAAPDSARPLGTFVVRWTQQLEGSAGIGLLTQSASRAEACLRLCDLRGFHLQLELGWNGTQVSAGYGQAVARLDRTQRWVTRPHLGYVIDGVWVRQWSDGWRGEAGDDWLGVEARIAAVGIQFSVTALRRIGAQDGSWREGDRWKIAGGVGWGF